MEFNLLQLILVWAGVKAPDPSAHRHHIRVGNRTLTHVRKWQASQRRQAVFTDWRALDRDVFEELVRSTLHTHGYRIQRSASYAGDGVDGRVDDPGGNLMRLQSKRCRDMINPQHVKAFATAVSDQGASGGLFVHTGRTEPSSWEHANAEVKILSGQPLIELLTATHRQVERLTSRH